MRVFEYCPSFICLAWGSSQETLLKSGAQGCAVCGVDGQSA
jgi:hypothetical protein